MRRDFYLHTRHHGIYYAELVDPETGRKLAARSTGEKDRDMALLKIAAWMAGGLPTGRARAPRPLEAAAGLDAILKSIRKTDLTGDDALRIVKALKDRGLIDIAAVKATGRGAVPFVQFLTEFWDYDRSEYIRDRLAHGYRFGRQYARECQNRLKAILAPFFADKKLNCITTDDLKELSRQLADRGFSTSTINQCMLIAQTPLKWAFSQKIIPENPAIGLTRFSITYKERGILTGAEAAEVFGVEWDDKRAFVASLVAVTTGARMGECLALRRNDIGANTLNIRHSWSPLDGLKCPKNGHTRGTPLLPEVRAALLDLLKDNPHDIEDPFVFYSLREDRPVDCKTILAGLKDAIEKVNAERKKTDPDAEMIDRKGRGICFHSWRHYFCSRMTDVLEGEKVAKVSDHLSEAVFRKYADHIEAKNITEVGAAAARVFSNILEFRRKGA
jgi:integrase